MSCKNIYIIGPYNSGTNLVHNIIKNCVCKDLINNNNIIIDSCQNKPFGKHIIDINIIKRYLENPNNLLIIMYKNIYNWLYSIKKACYAIEYTKLYRPVKFNNTQFPNMIELYNFYYINYLSLLNNYTNVIFLNYERIIDKNKSFNYINQKLEKINLYISSEYIYNLELMKPAKTHGKSVKTCDDAKKKYLINQNTVKNFVNLRPQLKKSIKQTLISFYENET